MKEVAKTPELDLSEIRSRHIDIIPIIEEELSHIVHQCIEDTIRNVYGVVEAI